MRAVVALGSNIGDRAENLRNATQLLAEQAGVVLAESTPCETAPWGFDSPNAFLNSVLVIETALAPVLLLKVTQCIEQQMGRTSKSHGGVYADRIIDIDLIDCGGMVLHTAALTLPHPLAHRRAFVLEPLCQVWPEWQHPLLRRTAAQLLAALRLEKEKI